VGDCIVLAPRDLVQQPCHHLTMPDTVASSLSVALPKMGLTVMIDWPQPLSPTHGLAPGSVRNGTCCLPWTVQKQIHLIILLSSLGESGGRQEGEKRAGEASPLGKRMTP
jgi:hypothetical protein